ncbi:unnamed protein product [Spirodela intermedia]|uniref:Uncharacterized protein n=1 Tax=Spirodela intermedia TaxID=51605 RepID=A0A7I8KE73_SPIIN|nr:unnamed protein product [Spirodela intermedia]
MAVVFGSRGQSVAGDDKTMKTAREEEEGGADGSVFDMFSLMAQLPQKRKGLSRYFSGKSRSFTRVGEVKCAGDLEKLEIPEAKRGKYAGRHAEVLAFVSCGTASGLSRCGSALGFTGGLAEK